MKTFKIQDTEAGNIIESGIQSESDAIEKLLEFEHQDRREGIFTPGFYEVVEEL